ncbi:interaptin [Apis laboriosa]|uniref:interaptin n=1 Tax=Apis laboriosa TaxID=183418 RepID=UPI001CC72834|nr:interaptin [Apis laboriosa]
MNLKLNVILMTIASIEMSEKSIRPIRQLSLQPPAPRRHQVRRQRSAEDEKSLQICASPFARGKRGTCKLGSERPKVRVAWKEPKIQRNEEELGQVEVVARQIPGRSKSSSGRSRGFIGIEKSSIFYSRLELAERLRLAWQNREKNKANINIFLARETLDERCDSEISNHTTAPSSPVNDKSKIEIPLDNNYKMIQDEDREKEDEKVVKKLENNDATTSGRNDDKLSINFLPLEKNKVSVQSREREKVDTEKEQQISKNSNIDEYVSSIKKKQPSDCSNHRLTSTLPSIKIENSPLGITKKEDFSSAKQKRASFHSGTNRAFLDPIRSEMKWSSISEKNSFQKSSIDNRVTIIEKNFLKQTIENKENDTTDEKNTSRENSPCSSIANGKDAIEKTAVSDKSNCVDNKNEQIKTMIENRDNLQDDKTIREADQSNSICRKISSTNDIQVSSNIIENKDDSTIDKSSSSRNSEARPNSMNDRNPPIKKTVENQKTEQKSRRTNSAPPQRRFGSISANNNNNNIVIDSMRKNRNQKDQDMDCNTVEKIDTVTKISSSRSVRSAPLKRRSRSAKRRFCGGGTSKNEEENGKSRNRSGTRAKNSIDSRTMDIVTMVSLVSSADSDSDIENSFRDDKLIDELRSKLPTTSIIKTSINSALSSARRPIKSVSFQKDSFDEEYSLSKEQQLSPKEEKRTTESWLAIVGNQRGATSSKEEAISWKTDVTGGGLTLPILALIHDIEEPLDVPLTDREKRCLAVPICDLHDKKQKLLKTRNTRSGIERQITSMKIKRETQESPIIISRKIDVSAQQSKTTINNSIVNAKTTCILPSKETLQHMQSIEPQFQTNKEKECWHLYKKMCDKGVCVSFDTVLRGMLTPTEYRLRQREVLQNL